MQLFIGKIEFASFRNLVLLLCVLSGHCVKISAQEFKTLKPGVEYAEVTREISGKQVQMNLLRLDLKKVRLNVHHALDSAIGTEKTSSIATRHGAFAAINAGFFRLDKSIWAGEAAGLLKIDNILLSESSNKRIAMGIDNQKKKTIVTFGHIDAKPELTLITFGDVGYAIDGMNREPKLNESILFTQRIVTPKLVANSTQLIIRNRKSKCDGELFRNSLGGTQVPENGYIVVYGPDSNQNPLTLIKKIFERRGIQLPSEDTGIPIDACVSTDGISLPSWSVAMMRAEDIVAGVPQLIKNRKIDITWEQEKASRSFVETRHPRTAVAKLKDGKFLMITVDGRSEASGGIGLQDLAEYLLSLGATDAMNLDGGGSTTMFVDGKVVNHPSDKDGERKVSDAILVTLRKK